MKKRNWKEVFMTAFDVLFVLILCFVILLTTMLVTKGDGGEAFTGYSLNLPLLCAVVLALAVYLGVMLKVSIGMLRKLIRHYFAEKGEPGKEAE